jgi:hypothetical protein
MSTASEVAIILTGSVRCPDRTRHSIGERDRGDIEFFVGQQMQQLRIGFRRVAFRLPEA